MKTKNPVNAGHWVINQVRLAYNLLPVTINSQGYSSLLNIDK